MQREQSKQISVNIKENVRIIQLLPEGQNIYSYQYQMKIDRDQEESTYRQGEADIENFNALLENFLKGLTPQTQICLLFKELRTRLEECAKSRTKIFKTQTFSKFYLHTYRLILKHILCFFSFLYTTLNLQSLLEQCTQNKVGLLFQSFQENKETWFVLSFASVASKSQIHSSSQQGRGQIGTNQQSHSGRNILDPHLKKIGFKNVVNEYLINDGSNKLLMGERGNPCTFYLIHTDKQAKLGEGGFGFVFKAQSISFEQGTYKEQLWAAKQIKKELKEQQSSNIGPERQHNMLAALSQLSNFQQDNNSQNIIKIHEVLVQRNKKYIIYQFCPFKDLGRFCNQKSEFYGQITKKHIFLILLKIISTLQFLHYNLLKNAYNYSQLNSVQEDGELKKDREMMSMRPDSGDHQKGIIHRDLKPNNIMIKDFSAHFISIKIIDWAFSKRTLTEEPLNSLRCGTDTYQAPEFDKKGEKYNCNVDVWAFGLIAHYLLTGKSLISRTNATDKFKAEKLKTQQKIKNMLFLSDKKFTPQQIDFYKHLLSKCLTVDPKSRWSSQKAANFLRQNNSYSIFGISDISELSQLNLLRVRFYQYSNMVLFGQKSKLLQSAVSFIVGTWFKIYFQLVRKKMKNRIVEDCRHVTFLMEFQRIEKDLKMAQILQNTTYSSNQNQQEEPFKKQTQKALNLFQHIKKYVSPQEVQDLLEVFMELLKKNQIKI